MAKAIKSVSIFAVFFIFFLLISEVPEIGAQHDDCLEIYGLCSVLIKGPSSLCNSRCQKDKRALSGKCIWVKGWLQCVCDFCSKDPNPRLDQV
ncbi:hypothetical protein AALP_AA4G225100 [Arabis alpina]|uniref:Knottin scorpion toxin-like domain-containing protein n=1 Tax=Arabis alpina TaxID=50452 RepID=A0A087H4Y4_ARAAL|nr:hypothetical protein AALP_AA4G225100 [Arabis alpina]